MKLNWGHYLIIAFILFACMVFYFVYTATQSNIELASKTPYEDALQYDAKYDKLTRTQKLDSIPTVLYEGANGIIITFPKYTEFAAIKGVLSVENAAVANKDFSIPIQLDANYQQRISKEKLAKGVWNLAIDWKMNNMPYYSEHKIKVE